jgi:peptide/nickel transport system permease protein
MKALTGILRQLLKYKAATVGLIIITIMILVAIYTVIAIPYHEADRLWRAGTDIWRENPRNALPAWVNIFPGVNLPKTVKVTTEDVERKVESLGSDIQKIEIPLTFDFTYDGFPKEVSIAFSARYKTKKPFVAIHWYMPDGREFTFGNRSVASSEWYIISQDRNVVSLLGGLQPNIGLFSSQDNPQKPLKGTYKVVLETYLFEKGSALDAKLIVYGQVYGLAGTDHLRRDLMLGLLWGDPIALAFGIPGALATIVVMLIIAATGVWYGGWVDALIQRVTEIRMILPTLPILIIIAMFYSSSVWMMLGTIILLSIVGGGIKTFRAMFLQEKNAPYIEAARCYGVSNTRMIFRYLIPRAIPWLVPSFVLLIPDLVFLEASLAMLGLGDPSLPTWGKILEDAFSNGALYHGYYYWVLEPSLLLMLIGYSFTMVGFTLDRIINPRLRER